MLTGRPPALVIAGEQWELPYAAATLRSVAGCLPSATDVVVPPEFAQLAASREVTCLGEPPGRFRGFAEIAADLEGRLAGRRCVVLPAGALVADAEVLVRALASAGAPAASWSRRGASGTWMRPPPHRPPEWPAHQRRDADGVQIWTADTGTGYFAALPVPPPGDAGSVWTAYGPGRPVFCYNTNSFLDEVPPPSRDDYFVLASGLLGIRMLLESGPRAGARVVVYDINPAQLDWTRFVLRQASKITTLPGLIAAFAGSRAGVTVHGPLSHARYRQNAADQDGWYAANRLAIAGLADRLAVSYLQVDLLRDAGRLLSLPRPDRTAFFMYLDLFVVWHVLDDPPWIAEFPGLASSLEAAVRERTLAASFLPGPGSAALQLAGSPLFDQDAAG